jgi:hypothetical protein
LFIQVSNTQNEIRKKKVGFDFWLQYFVEKKEREKERESSSLSPTNSSSKLTL